MSIVGVEQKRKPNTKEHVARHMLLRIRRYVAQWRILFRKRVKLALSFLYHSHSEWYTPMKKIGCSSPLSHATPTFIIEPFNRYTFFELHKIPPQAMYHIPHKAPAALQKWDAKIGVALPGHVGGFELVAGFGLGCQAIAEQRFRQAAGRDAVGQDLQPADIILVQFTPGHGMGLQQLPPGQRRGADDLVSPQKLPVIDPLRRDEAALQRFPAAAHADGAGIEKGRARLSLQPELLFQFLRQPGVVPVQEGHPVRPRRVYAPVAALRHAAVFFVVQQPDPAVLSGQMPDPLPGFIRGGVVHHEDLDLPQRLIHSGAEGFLDCIFAVVRRDHDAAEGLSLLHHGLKLPRSGRLSWLRGRFHDLPA